MTGSATRDARKGGSELLKLAAVARKADGVKTCEGSRRRQNRCLSLVSYWLFVLIASHLIVRRTNPAHARDEGKWRKRGRCWVGGER